MIPAARKFDAKKEVDTARAAFTSFFVARFPWGDFSGAFSVGGLMPLAAGEIAADLGRIAPPRCGRRPAPGRLHPPRGDAGDSSTPPPTLHSIRERSTARRAGSMRTERRRGDCTGHGAHLTAAGVDAGQDAAAPMGTARPMGSTPPATLRAATHTTPPALHSYIGEDSTARRPHSTPHTAAPAMLHPAPPRWRQRTAARST